MDTSQGSDPAIVLRGDRNLVDFSKLRAKKKRPNPVDPLEIFRRLPKSQGINDLYTSQAEVLAAWFERRDKRDLVLKLHTGGGKTLVGLLIGQSTLNEKKEPVLYLAPTVQLVNQALTKAQEYGIPAVPYVRGQRLDDDFVNAKAILVATYKALFNGRSKFGLRGGYPQSAGSIILDDAHVAFSVVREAFTLTVSAEDHRDRYESLAGLFRRAFNEIDRLGTFDRPEQAGLGGPDVLWLLPKNVGLIIEAKSRKKEKNALTKAHHGQLLVATEWFESNYPGFRRFRVCVHPQNKATKAAIAGASHALTYEKLNELVSDARVLFTKLCESQLPENQLELYCEQLLQRSDLESDRLVDRYFSPFQEELPP